VHLTLAAKNEMSIQSVHRLKDTKAVFPRLSMNAEQGS
jgi:hypothetical protein